jgi:prefoldin subunit 5
LRAAVRRFLAHGRLARLAACLIVAFAAVVWIAVASIVLRVLFVAVLVVILTACVWLIAGIWIGEQVGNDDVLGSAWRVARRWARRVVPRPHVDDSRAEVVSHTLTRDDEELGRRERELTEREEAFATVRASVDAAIADLHRRQERLHTDGAQLQEKLAEQIEAMRAVVARMAELGQGISVPARAVEQPTRLAAVPAQHEPVAAARPPEDIDLYAARLELEADLRLEKLEEHEQMLRDLEEQLTRREHQLADLVAQTQGQLSPIYP